MRAVLFTCFLVGSLVRGNSAAETELFSEELRMFAVKIYQQLSNSTTENLLISPLTIESLLALSASGATNETAQELYEILSLPPNRTLFRDFFRNTILELKNGEHYTLNNTNRIFLSANVTVLEDFKRNADEIFGVKLEEKSEDEDFDDWTLLLNNELHFKGLWSKRFENRSTYKAPFYVSADETIEVETMHSTGDYSYYEDKELKADFVEIPFKGNEVTITIALPNEANTLEQLEERLADVLAAKKYKATYVKMALPKFTLLNEIDYTDALKELGITKAFDEMEASFGGITNSEIPLHIGGVSQKTFVQIEEKGGRGVAVDSVPYPRVIGTHKRAKPFIVERPFLFFLRKNGVTFLIGKVRRPQFKSV